MQIFGNECVFDLAFLHVGHLTLPSTGGFWTDFFKVL